MALAALAFATGCGSERSTAAYCKAYNSGFDRIKSEYPDVDQYSHAKNPLLLLLRTTSALGDIVALIGDMAGAAPDDIKTDTQRVHDSMRKQLDLVGGTSGSAATGDLKGLLSGIGGAFVDSITNAGAYQRMDAYIVANCGGRHMFSASPQT
ncbi:MAG TPA: hypothetical protein VFG42_13175 [Baekduia sp.]|uniref:hypothetical protein n=1 Tax=Baekduia sp. TaxID=2600305 RepID=UPI002D77ABBF|nr:hypothetical protein [Baekduia sp.]HET6507736.1 hypothetical protein [Baekduia sp.]